MFAVVPEAVTLGETAVGSAVASNVGKKVLQDAPQVVPVVERVAATELGAAKNLAQKGASFIGQEAKVLPSKLSGSAANAATKGAENAAEGAAKESMKKKVFDAVVLGGVLPGVGFTAASNYLSKPSSDSNPDVANGDLVNAHKSANGDHNKLMNHKFDNGKTFKDVQKNYLKDNGNLLKKVDGEKQLLYTENGSPTPVHKTAILHGIKLDKNK